MTIAGVNLMSSEMKNPRPPFIVLEGLDGSGTTTQARLLTAHFESSGTRAFPTYEPTDGPAGKLIRDVLSGKLYNAESNQKIVLSEKTLCLLFAADRLDHTSRIDLERAAGNTIVCDRYILSSLAYQTLDSTISPEWVIEVNKGCAVPDLTILLKVPASECLKRLRKRKEMRTIYEKQRILEAIDANYDRMIAPYRRHFGTVVTLDGTGSPGKILEDIVAAIRSRAPAR